MLIDSPPNDAVRLHLTKLLDEHFLRNSRYGPFEIREAQYFSTEEMKEDDQFPATLQDFERVLYALSGCNGGVAAYLPVCTLLFRAFLSFRNASAILEYEVK